MKNISILIPTYNDDCTTLVRELQQQAALLPTSYEIIVADDGSTDSQTIERNRAINKLQNCRMIERPENSGRAAIRNFLATEAKYEWLLFIDGDMTVCRQDYIERYATAEGSSVFDGGITVGTPLPENLRSLYETASEQTFTADKRSRSPYQDFHTANFMVRRDIMLAHPFDLRFRRYGYEDVLFGKVLQQEQIAISHIENPLSFEIFETNPHFVSKTEEGLRTLHHFRDELDGYSRLLRRVSSMPHPVLSAVRWWHRLFGPLERRLLTGSHPNLFVFNLYKLGYFISLG